MRSREQHYITMFWGRENCCNREQIVEMENSPEHYIVLTVEHQSFRKQRDGMKRKLQGAVTKEKGWGTYLSVHAAAKDLGVSKAAISAVLDDRSKNVSGWFFSSLRIPIPNSRDQTGPYPIWELKAELAAEKNESEIRQSTNK
jgi:hypothetical protein